MYEKRIQKKTDHEYISRYARVMSSRAIKSLLEESNDDMANKCLQYELELRRGNGNMEELEGAKHEQSDI